jgi:ABC-2 type transport system permease protein
MSDSFMGILSAVVRLLFLDLVFLGFLVALVLLVLWFSKRWRAAYAVLKRNFFGYFANPTGYVFLCLFVLLTSMAAFWPNQFFSSNLATLAQLNNWFPFIMLFFIPAITMSIWADERRQGTDELLLTLPADDFDIVIGKFLAAASIYTTSLLFSQISTFIVLVFLTSGGVDTGLFFANYVGYWCIGVAMISIGMIASFVTNNLTVGFILGALFNAPLAFAAMSEVIAPDRGVARFIKQFSIAERFDDFGRGVLSLSSTIYFILLVVFGLYLCMILIGRRHWSGGKDGNKMFFHYLGRAILLAIAVIGFSMLLRNNDRRVDATEGQVSSLSPMTRTMISSLAPDRPIIVEAYISAEVPELYARTKYNLVTMLKEFESVAKRKKIPLEVRVFDNLETFSEEASRAEQQYGISAQSVRVRERGTMADQKLILGAAFKSGLEKVIVPFFDSGTPVEYELIRSLNTVSQPKRKKLGVLRTDAQLTGGFSQTNFQQIPRQAIITELAKQYEIIDVDASSAINPSAMDVLLAVQPSTLAPEQMVNFVNAVKAGIPTAIFEDPMPFTFGFPGTGEPKQAGGGMFGGGGPQPKGDILPLWKALGLEIPGTPAMTGGLNPDVCWQSYNPYPVLEDLSQATDQWIFCREEAPGAEDALSEKSDMTRGLREVMLLYSGVIRRAPGTSMDMTELLSTGAMAGTISFDRLNGWVQQGGVDPNQLRLLQGVPTGRQVVAVEVKGKAEATPAESEETKADAEKKDEVKDGEKKDESTVEVGAENKRPIHAVYVADADCMNQVFVDIRNRPEQFEEINFRLQNVTFALNIVDVLAGETSYPEIRRHEPQHSTLRLVEAWADQARTVERTKREEFREKFDTAKQEAEAENTKNMQQFEERVQKLQREGATDPSKQKDLIDALQQVELKRKELVTRLEVKLKQLQRDRDKNVTAVQREVDLQIRKTQNWCKAMAVFIPPIPPLLVGIIVFVSRRLREREGISKARLR